MSDISRVAGVGPTIKLGGLTLTANPKTMRHYGEISAEIIRRRGNPMDLIRQAREVLTPDIVQQFVEKAFEEAIKWKTVTTLQLFEFLQTLDGMLFMLWLSVRDNDRSLYTLEHVSMLYLDEYEARLRAGGAKAAQEYEAEIEASLSQADSDNELGNSTGSPLTSAVASPVVANPAAV